MEQTQHLVRIGHTTDPSIPRRIFKAISKACEDKRDYKHRVRRVQAVHHVRNEMASRPE